MINIVLAILLFTLKLGAEEILTSYTVSPPLVEVDLDHSRSGLVTVVNESDREYMIRVDCQYFSPAELHSGRHILEGVEEKEDISDLVVISPRVLKMKAAEERIVRFTVRPVKKRLKSGEYRCNLVFTPVLKKENTVTAAQIRSVLTKIDWIVQMRVPLYAIKGTSEPEIDIIAQRFRREHGIFLQIKAFNSTKWRYPARFKVYDRNGKLADVKKVILRGSERIFEVELSRDSIGEVLIKWESYVHRIKGLPGEYVLRGF